MTPRFHSVFLNKHLGFEGEDISRCFVCNNQKTFRKSFLTSFSNVLFSFCRSVNTLSLVVGSVKEDQHRKSTWGKSELTRRELEKINKLRRSKLTYYYPKICLKNFNPDGDCQMITVYCREIVSFSKGSVTKFSWFPFIFSWKHVTWEIILTSKTIAQFHRRRLKPTANRYLQESAFFNNQQKILDNSGKTGKNAAT